MKRKNSVKWLVLSLAIILFIGITIISGLPLPNGCAIPRQERQTASGIVIPTADLLTYYSPTEMTFLLGTRRVPRRAVSAFGRCFVCILHPK